MADASRDDSHDTFDAGWLGLREAADHRSRYAPFADLLAQMGTERGWTTALDLGSGTGSNIRYLAPRLPWARRWIALDHDPELLARLVPPEGVTLEPVRGRLEAEGLDAVRRSHLVTASALLDLVSREWLEALGEALAGSGAAACFALSYDGQVRLDGGAPDPDDAFVVEALNLHQRQEKGLGRALGPDATSVAVEVLGRRGYRCHTASTPWVLRGPGDTSLGAALMAGWAEAARELHPGEGPRLDRWLERRTRSLAEGRLSVTVGHQDLLALPAGESG